MRINETRLYFPETAQMRNLLTYLFPLLVFTFHSIRAYSFEDHPSVTLPYIRSATSLSSKKPVIVFVHGIFGDPAGTWRYSSSVYWPQLLASDQAYKEWDIYVAKYPTPYLGSTMSLDEVVSSLNSRMINDGVFSRHSEVVFVCHSLGGLVVQRLLLTYRDYAEQVRFIYFFGTPQTGAEIARVGHAFSGDPLLQTMFPGDKNSYLLSLENEWKEAHFTIKRYCAYESKPYLGFLVVDRLSGTRNCDFAPIAIEENHIGLVKPNSTTHASYIALANALNATPVTQSKASANKPKPTIVGPNERWEPTGDRIIDAVQEHLNRLEFQRSHSDKELAANLRPLFEQPVFMYIGEELPNEALYRFCRNSQILDFYISSFSNPRLRSAALAVTQKLIYLQEVVGGLYGTTFSAQQHCSKYGSHKKTYLDNLPPQVKDRDSVRESASNVLRDLQQPLRTVSLMDDPNPTERPKDPDRRLSLEEELGDQDSDEKNYDEARAAYEVALCSDPTNLQLKAKITDLPDQTIYSLRKSARQLLNRQQWKCAETLLLQAIRAKPPDPEQDFYLWGNALKSEGDVEDAVIKYARVEEMLPKSDAELKPGIYSWVPYFREEYGWALQSTGEYERALELFNKARQWRPTGDCIPSTSEEVRAGVAHCQ
jgi:tetratricopeptide (TPR) repeat protein